MEKNKTTVLLSRDTVNRLCKLKGKIGDTYDTVINDVIDKYEAGMNENKGGY
ncbi:MAG: hypothetical protein GW779_02430 [Candidatus Altiarchaeum hamiconexum]|uniref:Uncharacterized protein n=1 Tax=Candidatus Altarchaeum hamiconexum TaxID=1803513 RepID=A0A8J7YU95_9ARCH|nr:hypothetical protein [Candidatus Altarchaeum hamiconexum]NCN68899.1 hypothetical protein [Candidatus Altarchaeum hamiconexum]NCS91267.1 hypothetical protein [Candidatus Altarchaeum hamiconexum]NCT01272.1 hypothetical protein [Candidatus Altarchaeum hamiconexum]